MYVKYAGCTNRVYAPVHSYVHCHCIVNMMRCTNTLCNITQQLHAYSNIILTVQKHSGSNVEDH